ncbi:MAG: hypothetical protein M0P70_02360 [Desulfobulbaceae bacterium]|nr:hypothetical protein [Desulfobulbaceae bacterium]
MKTVYILWHIHHLSDGNEDEKILGVYSSRTLAEHKIEKKFKKLPGFKKPEGEFVISEYFLDQDQWEEGFVTE